MSTKPALAAALSLSLSVGLAAQQLQSGGFAHVKRSFNASDATTRQDVVLTGVGYLPANNGVHGVTHPARIYLPGSAQGARMYVLDIDGTFVRRPRDPSTRLEIGGTNSFDLANDGVATLFAGSDAGIACFEGDRATLVTTCEAANGTQTIVNPIAGPGLGFGQGQLSVFRAVAYDPNGNGGNGSLFVGNVGVDPILEIDLDGNVLNTWANDDGNGRQAWDASGLALDPVTGNLWVNSGPQDANGQWGTVIELDRNNNMLPTGVGYLQSRRGGFQGGLDSMRGGDPGSQPSHYDHIVMTRLTGEDFVSIHRVHASSTVHGKDEPFLEGRINSGTFSTGRADAPGELGGLNVGDRFEFRINPGTSGQSGSALCFLNVGRNALVDGETILPFFGNPVVRELRAQWAFSNPPSAAGLDFPCQIGTGNVVSLPVPAGVINCFDLMKVQALYLEPSLLPFFPPVLGTNELWANFFEEGDCNIVVEAFGTNSRNPGLREQPFYQVQHRGGPAITQIKFSFSASNDGHVRSNLYFDTDDTFGAVGGVTRKFLAGNGNFPLCDGTYRGTDGTTGLVYDALNDPPDACNITAGNSGVISSDGTNNNPGFAFNRKELTFRFTNFGGGTAQNPVFFLFDCVTEDLVQGAAALHGGQVAGMVVFVTLANGEQTATELRVDPQRPNRRSVGGL